MESSPNANPHPSAAGTLSYPSSTSSVRPVGRTGSPPWTQIVRGPELESAGAPPRISLLPQVSNDNNAGSKKPESDSVVLAGPVVIGGAASWPALSESTKASTKLSHSANSGLVPVSIPVLQVTGLASSPLPSPLQQSSLTSQKPTASNLNHFSSNNAGRPARQRSIKRDGGGNAQPLPHVEGLSNHNHSAIKPSSTGSNESSGRDNRESRNSFRRQNSVPHSRGDGSHQNYGGRRGDHDRGNHDWNHHRSFNGRDTIPMQSRGVGPRSFVPVSAPFVHPVGPAPIRPFINPMGIPEMPVMYFPPGVPFVAPVHPPMFFPAPDSLLSTKIVNQIDYYFSNENLVKDTFLRRNMDQNGWVPVSLIAGFKKVMQLTDNMQLILEAMRSSTVVETQGDKIRRRNDWMRWIMPSTVQFPSTSSSETPNVSTLSTDTQNVSPNERITNTKAEVLSISSS